MLNKPGDSITFSDKIVGIILDPVWKGVLRVGACVVGLSPSLGEQWYSLGKFAFRRDPKLFICINLDFCFPL